MGFTADIDIVRQRQAESDRRATRTAEQRRLARATCVRRGALRLCAPAPRADHRGR